MTAATPRQQSAAHLNPWHAEERAEAGTAAPRDWIGAAARDIAWALLFTCAAPVWACVAWPLAYMSCMLSVFLLELGDQIELISRPFSEPVMWAPVLYWARIPVTVLGWLSMLLRGAPLAAELIGLNPRARFLSLVGHFGILLPLCGIYLLWLLLRTVGG